jgi:hypothetical protein
MPAQAQFITCIVQLFDLIHVEWEAINRKQITRWQHVSQLKASSFYLLVKKIIIVKNATAYTRDWYCHLVVDRASLKLKFRSDSFINCYCKKELP